MGKIYTRSGDEGNTHLFGGQRVSKSVPRVVAYGAVDELNSHVGVLRSVCEDTQISEILKKVQSLLFVCGADLASPARDDETGDQPAREKRIREEDVQQIEEWIDNLSRELTPLNNFVLPGETPLAARMHMARSICRRAERATVTLNEQEPLQSDTILPFLNRLSDLFFTLARVCNEREGIEEIPWNAPLPEHDDQAKSEKDISFDED